MRNNGFERATKFFRSIYQCRIYFLRSKSLTHMYSLIFSSDKRGVVRHRFIVRVRTFTSRCLSNTIRLRHHKYFLWKKLLPKNLFGIWFLADCLKFNFNWTMNCFYLESDEPCIGGIKFRCDTPRPSSKAPPCLMRAPKNLVCLNCGVPFPKWGRVQGRNWVLFRNPFQLLADHPSYNNNHNHHNHNNNNHSQWHLPWWLQFKLRRHTKH